MIFFIIGSVGEVLHWSFNTFLIRQLQYMLLPVSRAGSNVKAPFSFLRKFHCLPSTFPPLLVAMPTLEIHPFLTIKIFRNPPSNQVCILFFKLEVRYCGLKFSMCLPPNSSVMVHYETSHLKVLKFLREKNQTDQFFLVFLL